jgi:hypothetical protein
MNIKDFKKGDIITRNKKAVYSCGSTDGSYIGSPFEFIGFCSTKIVLIGLKQYCGYGECEIKTLNTKDWEDGWDYYPMDKMHEAQKKILAIAEALSMTKKNEEDSNVGKYKRGQLVKTCDGRYGFIKEIDWHARMFIKRDDYQIQFPDGVGIFRADEFEIIDNPPIN